MSVAQEHAPANSVTFGSMPMSVSVPEGLSWHMILDHELSQLTRPESGVFGSVGFVAVGAFLGLVPAVFSALEKLKAVAPGPASSSSTFTMSDLATVVVCGGSLVLAIVCLIIFGLVQYRNRGLATKIRKRTTRDFTFSNSAAE